MNKQPDKKIYEELERIALDDFENGIGAAFGRLTESAAIDALNKNLPGWWWTMGNCSVSAHASCGPDRSGPDADLLDDPVFDSGFDFDDSHENEGACPAKSLVIVMLMAMHRKGLVNG